MKKPPHESPESLLRKSVPGLGEGRFFYGKDAATFWNGFFLMLGLVAVVPVGFATHSSGDALGFALLYGGGVLVWRVGRRILAGNCYFIGDEVFGYRDVFGTRLARFDEVTGVRVRTGRSGTWLEIDCRTERRRMSSEIDSAWLEALKEQCAIRRIPVS